MKKKIGRTEKWIIALVLVLPLALGLFGTASAGTPVDQASAGTTPWRVNVTPRPCALKLPDAGTPYAVTVVGTSWLNVPGTSGAGVGDAGVAANLYRSYIVVCNSKQSVATALLKCTSDGTTPVMAAGNIGEVLAVGACVSYSSPVGLPQAVKCIADTASTYALSFECI